MSTAATPQTEADRAFVARALEALDTQSVRQWLVERQANCLKFARNRTGADREGWLIDFTFFTAAAGMIDWTALERADAAAKTGGAQ